MRVEVDSFSIGHGLENGDSVGELTSGSSTILAIADGVGSSQYSHQSSRLAIEAAIDVLSGGGASAMPAAFKAAKQAVTTRAIEMSARSMSTTLTVCCVVSKSVFFGHVGDSRLYHLRGEGLQTRTTDQTEVQHLLSQGVISRERAKRYPRKNVLLSAISSNSSYDLQTGSFEIEAGDRILLVTDGIHNQIGKKEIALMSLKNQSTFDFMTYLKSGLEKVGIVDDSSALCATFLN